jgi:hypothetical protein
MAEPASYELEGEIATITMDDGKVNVFSIPMLRSLHQAFDQAERDGAVVILTGRDGYFSAGFDLKTIAGGPDQLREMLTLGATWPTGCSRSPGPWWRRARATPIRREPSCCSRRTPGSVPPVIFGSGSTR